MGPSGSGKSTLMHLLGGLDRPTRGRVLFEGVEQISSSRWTKLRSKRIGFVFQDCNLLPTLTALENVQIPMFGNIARAKDRYRKAMTLLDRVGLAARTRHRPKALSGGERQRVAIARSLANSPVLILADEPTGNLDSKTSEEIMDLLENIRNTEKATLVIVTHDVDISKRADRIVKLFDGQIKTEG
jgi:putative ABC transport system ATP-binding protein